MHVTPNGWGIAPANGSGEDVCFVKRARGALRETFPNLKAAQRELCARNWTDRRVRSFWEGDATRIDAKEWEDVKAVTARSFPARLQSLKRSMEATDAAFFGPQIEALAEIERQLREQLGG